MNRVKIFRIGLCIGIASAICQTASGTLITPESVTSSTAATDLWSASNLINGETTGLSAPVNESSIHFEAGLDNSWVTAQPSNKNDTDYYAYAFGQPPVLIFGLDQLYNLDGIVVWNYAASGDPATHNGAKCITLEFSRDGLDGPFGNAVLLTVARGGANESCQAPRFGGVFADAVRLTITDNYYDGTGGGDRVGLSEIKFFAPEPSSMLLIGTGLLGFVCFVFLARGRKLIVRVRGDVS